MTFCMVAELPEVFIKTIVEHKHVRHERREINAGDPCQEKKILTCIKFWGHW